MNLKTLFFRELKGNNIARDDYDYIIENLTGRTEDSYYPNDTCPVLQAKFSPNGKYLGNVNDMGYFSLSKIGDDYNLTKVQKQLHQNTIFDFDWSPTETAIITASGDRTTKFVRILDFGSFFDEMTFDGHESSVRAVCFRCHNPDVFATAGRDGAIIIWDKRDGKRYQCYIPDAHCANKFTTNRSANKVSIISIKFINDNQFFSAGHTGGYLCSWDIRNLHNSRGLGKTENCLFPPGLSFIHGFSDLAYNQSSPILYASCTNSKIYAFNVLFGKYCNEPSMIYSGHMNGIDRAIFTKMAISSDNKYIISGSQDSKAYIWNMKRSTPIVALSSHQNEVNSVAWRSHSDPFIVTYSDDELLRKWIYKRDDDCHFFKKSYENGTVEILNKYLPKTTIKFTKKYKQAPCCDRRLNNSISGCTHFPLNPKLTCKEIIQILQEKLNIQCNKNSIDPDLINFIDNLPKRSLISKPLDIPVIIMDYINTSKTTNWLQNLRREILKKRKETAELLKNSPKKKKL